MRYFEDFPEGLEVDLGQVSLTEDEIVAFARQFDPQPMHTDAVAARASIYGGLIASGWHTAALYMGMFVRGVLLDSASLGSPGVEELRWLAPVRPGDELRGRSTIADARASSTNPRRGTVFTTHEVVNQDGTVVMTMKARGFFARRPD